MRPGINQVEIERILQQQMRLIVGWMSQDHVWHQIATVADELAAHETLEEEQLDELRYQGFLGK